MEKISSICLIKIEAFLRLFALLSLLVAAIVLLTDRQTKIYFGAYQKKVNYKIADILIVSLYVYVIGAVHNLLQLVRCLAFNKHEGDKLSWSGHILQWIYFFLDQMAVYVIFATVCATTQVAVVAIGGTNDFEWMKLCNKFVRFCVHFGGSVASGFVASVVLALISGISTFNLFRWYSPNFLCLKPKKIGIAATTTTN